MDLHFEWDEDKAAVAGKPLRRSEDNMNEEIDEPSVPDDELLPEYDFSGGVRGKHHAAFQRGYKIVVHKTDGTTEVRDFILPEGAILLDPELRSYFPDSEAVNRALRGLIRLIPKRRLLSDGTP